MICTKLVLINSVAILLTMMFTGKAFKLAPRFRFLPTFKMMTDDASKVFQVYIGNLPFDIDSNQLKSTVSEKIGSSFKNIRVPKDRESGRGRGFGYIDFEEKESAESAVSALQGLEIDGRTLKVDLSEPRSPRSPSPRGERISSPRSSAPRPSSSDSSIYIGNLLYETTDDTVLELCKSVLGESVLKVKISIDRETGKSRGFGHVELSGAEQVPRALELLQGVEIDGRNVKVAEAFTKESMSAGEKPPRREFSSDRSSRQSAGPSFSVFIGNLAWNVNEDLLKEMIDDMLGPDLYKKVRLATDRDTGRSRGFAHIEFNDQSSADRAVSELNELEVLGRQLRVDHAATKTEGGGGGGGSRGGGRPRADRYNVGPNAGDGW